MGDKTHATWYPVKPGELHLTPVALAPSDTAKVIPANELKPGQIGYMAVDVPVGHKCRPTLEEAIGMFEGCCL